MRSHFNRLIFALVLSCFSFGGTYFWHKSETARLDRTLRNNSTQVIAQVSKVDNDVQKNQSSQLLWMQVNTGDQLYDGDSIQTSNRGEVRIQFDDGRYIDLEPDSLVKLEQAQGEIALNLVEGSLFVKASADAGADTQGQSGLVLTSASGKVDLSGASVALAKDKGQTEVNMQVFEGKAKVQGKDGQSKDIVSGTNSRIGESGLSDEKYDLKILSPAPQKPYPLDAESQRPVVFKWTGYPKDWKVSLHVGPTRKELKEAPSATSSDQSLSLKLPVGTHFWKLVAKAPSSGEVVTESPVFKTAVVLRYAPIVVFPVADAKIPMTSAPMDMTFKWQKVDSESRVVLEISKNATFTERISTQTFPTEDNYVLPQLDPGTYFWRISSYWVGDERPVSSKIQKFTLQKEVKVEVKDPLRVVWGLKPDQNTQYFVDAPSLDLSWTPDNRKEEVARWKLKVSEENSDPVVSSQWDLKEENFKVPVAKPGRYVASVDAYNKDGDLIGSSLPRTIAVAPLPLLATPKLTTDNGIILASPDGGADIQWQQINGAKEYLLTIQNLTENQTKEFKLKKNQATFKSQMLSPRNQYQLKVEAIDEHGRKSTDAQYVKLEVPMESNIQAPKLKGIKIKSNE